MSTRAITWRRLGAAIILAIGFGAAWATAWIFTSEFVAQAWQSEGRYYLESLGFTFDGTPIIVTPSGTSGVDHTYRTLDGKPWTEPRYEFLSGTRLAAPVEPARLFSTPVVWQSRITGLSDAQPRPTQWYVVRSGEPNGRAYLVGYDEATKLRVGYIGRNGFGRSVPRADEQFDVGRRDFSWGGGAYATLDAIQFSNPLSANPASLYNMNVPTPRWQLFLIDGDKLLEIDLPKRQVRTVFEAKDLVSVAAHSIMQPIENPTQEVKRIETVTDAGVVHEKIVAMPKVNLLTRLAVRMNDRIVMLDPTTESRREYSLPKQVRDKPIDIFTTLDETLIVQWREGDNYHESNAIWLAPDGKVARQETVSLDVNAPASDSMLVPIIAMPSPLGWIGGVFVGAPITMLHSGQSPTYSAAVASGLEMAWPALVAMIVIGTVLAGLTYRLQRKYHRPATWLWCTFVFLFGWFGFFAYWIEQRRPKLETCRKCDRTVPRDRDQCAACGTPFPAPALFGTEIFA